MANGHHIAFRNRHTILIRVHILYDHCVTRARFFFIWIVFINDWHLLSLLLTSRRAPPSSSSADISNSICNFRVDCWVSSLIFFLKSFLKETCCSLNQGHSVSIWLSNVRFVVIFHSLYLLWRCRIWLTFRYSNRLMEHFQIIWRQIDKYWVVFLDIYSALLRSTRVITFTSIED